MPLIPLADRVALRRLDPEPDPRAAGFVMPGTSDQKSTRCLVVAIPDKPYVTEWGVTIPCPVALGQTVHIGKYSGVENRVKNSVNEQEDWLFVRWAELHAVERDPAYPTYGDIDRSAAANLIARGKQALAREFGGAAEDYNAVSVNIKEQAS